MKAENKVWGLIRYKLKSNVNNVDIDLELDYESREKIVKVN